MGLYNKDCQVSGFLGLFASMVYTGFISKNKSFVISNIIGLGIIFLAVMLFNPNFSYLLTVRIILSFFMCLGTVSALRHYSSLKYLLCSLNNEFYFENEGFLLNYSKLNKGMELREDDFSKMDK